MHISDAFDRIHQLRGNTRRLFDAFSQDAPLGSPQALHKVLLALELRWKIEDVVLIPSLHGTQGVMPGGSHEAGRELDALRELAALAGDAGLGAEHQARLLGAIDALATLRSDRIHGAMNRAQRAALVDAQALGREMDRLLERWRDELVERGDAKALEANPLELH